MSRWGTASYENSNTSDCLPVSYTQINQANLDIALEFAFEKRTFSSEIDAAESRLGVVVLGVSRNLDVPLNYVLGAIKAMHTLQASKEYVELWEDKWMARHSAMAAEAFTLGSYSGTKHDFITGFQKIESEQRVEEIAQLILDNEEEIIMEDGFLSHTEDHLKKPKSMHCMVWDELSTECIPVRVQYEDGKIWIRPKGYGDCCSADGDGTPILIELFDGNFRVVVWEDINEEDPCITHLPNTLPWKDSPLRINQQQIPFLFN
jgi:hypothetical protein